MAEKMMFGIGFDLEQAVKDADGAWSSKYYAMLEKTFQKRPVNVKLGINVKDLDNLEAVQKRLKELRLAPVTPETKSAISSLVSELKKLETILKRVNALNAANARSNAAVNSANELAAQRAARTAEIQARTSARAQQDAIRQSILQERLNQAKNRTIQAERRLASAANETARAYSSTDGYISRLIKRTAVLFGITQVTRFAQRVREVTAEFELQRVSLGAIIQDTERANALFNQIKTFAIQSPFEIKDLVGYVKQLSAYRIETDKLFDTTKRLADVSAGLGVDMGRLILAYGQVKAASVLRGCLGYDTEVRTTLGIKKVQDIRVGDKLLNENNEVVTVKELIRGREQMYRVTQTNGMEYRVNANHILTLYNDGALHDIYVKDFNDTYLGVRVDDGELITYPIDIRKDIVDDYYGFVLDGNKRFQLVDGTVTHNTEVRQFTEAGIPLIQLLAEKFTKLRGEVVSTSEVFDLISKRAVSFEMVAEIFEDMTNAGGMFYNMQEKQARTLAGQWSNLKDSLSIMYDEMGNTAGVQSALKGVIDATKSLAENWQLVRDYATLALGAFAISKAKSMWNALGTQMFATTQKATIAQQRYNAALEKQNALLPTATNLERAAAAQKVKTAANALRSAQALEAAAASANRLAFAWKRLTTFMKTNWLSLAISALISLGIWISNVIRKSNELKNALRDIGNEGAKNISVMTRNFEILANKAVSAADGSKAQKDALDELQRTYRDMIPTHQMTIDNLREMAGRYDMLTAAIREYINQQTLSNQIEAIIGKTTDKVAKAQEKLRKELQKKNALVGNEAMGTQLVDLDFDERTIERAFAGIEYYARNTADDVKTIISNAFKDFAGIELTPEQVQAIENLGGLKTNVKAVVAAYREQEEQIRAVTERQNALTGETGKYADLIEAAEKKIKEFYSEDYEAGTFAFDEAKAKAGAEEYLAVIKQIFQDSGLTFDDAWVDGKYIDIDAINKALVDAGNKVSAVANKAFGKVARAYYELVPSDVFSKAINEKFKEVAKGLDVSMNLIKKHLKRDDTGIDEFVDGFFKSIEELELRIQQTRALLTSDDLSGSERDKKSADLKNYEQELEVMKAMIPFIKLFRLEKDKGAGGGDDRLSRLKEEVSLLEKVYAKYKEYTKYVSASDAQERINMEFGETLAIFKKYGIELPKTSKEFQEALRTLQDMMKKLPKSQKDVMELGFKIENVDWDDTKKNLEDELKRLAADVAKTKTAREFFNRMLNLTGDMQLSASVTMSVYGETGAGLFDKMKAEIVKQFGEFDVTLAFDTLNEVVDYKELERLYEMYREKIPSERRAGIEAMIKAGKEEMAANIKMWTEQLAKAKDFEQQRTDIVRQETENRIAILKSGMKPEDRDPLLQQSRRNEREQLAQVDVAEFKASDDYIKIFQDLDRVSDETIDRLIERLENMLQAMKAAGKEGTEAFKTLVDALEKLKDTERGRNDPIMQMIQAVKDYKAAKKELKKAKADLADAQEQYKIETKNNDVTMTAALKEQEEATKAVADAQALLNDLKESRDLEDIAAGENAEKDAQLRQQLEYQILQAQRELNAAKARSEKADEAVTKERQKQLATTKKLVQAEEKVTKAEDKKKKAAEDFEDGLEGGIQKARVFQSLFDDLKSLATEFFGLPEDSGFAEALQAASDAMQVMQTVIGIIITLQTIWNLLTAENPYMAIAMAVLAVAAAIATVIANEKVKKANKEIAKQQEILDALEKSYKRLQKEADKLFGSQFVDNIKQQQESILAQIDAKEKQLKAEQDKGKKTNDDTVKELQDDIDDLNDSYEDLKTTVSETMLGTDIKSAAETFAQSWLDAYKEFGDTRKAIEGEMKTMMENLIVQAVLGQVMKKALEPVFTMIDDMKTGDFYDEKFWQNLSEEAKKSTDNMDAGAANMMKFLEKAGINVREMGSGLSGIAKDIAQASEESILGLAAGINTQNYYMSHIDATVSQIAAMMTGGGVDFSSNEQIADLITMQNEHLAHLPSIALYTSQTAERCERAARACEDMADNLNRVIKPVGVKGSYAVNTAL